MVDNGVWSPAPVIRGAYLRWLVTQEGGAPTEDEWLESGWLVHEDCAARLGVRRE